jgi:uncharacterized alkaline shock family protein YloU
VDRGGHHVLASTQLGQVTVTQHAIAQIIRYSAAESYGVVDMAGKGLKKLLPGDRGVSVRSTPEGLRIDLHLVVEYGLNLAEVGATVRSRVAYEVERQTRLPVAAVEVHIEDVRRSA